MSKLLNFAVCTNANFTNGHIRTPLRSVCCHSERSFRYFWLDPKVTQRSRLRALHTPSRRLQVGKSGNSLHSDSLIFFRPACCSAGSPPEAHGRTPRAFGARFLTAFGMTKGAFGMTNAVICVDSRHLRNLRSDNHA